MMDIVNRLRCTRTTMLGTDDEQHFADCHKAADEIERLRAEVKHWKSNHDNRVEAARLLIERHDLPIDRIPAYKHYLRLQEDVQHYRTENEEQARLLGISSERELALRAEVERMRKDAARGKYMIAHSAWHRSDEEKSTTMVVSVPYGSDLSCYAMREAAIDAAMKKEQ